jgi:hypothetical protein
LTANDAQNPRSALTPFAKSRGRIDLQQIESDHRAKRHLVGASQMNSHRMESEKSAKSVIAG